MCEHVLGVWRLLGCLQLKPFSSLADQITLIDQQIEVDSPNFKSHESFFTAKHPVSVLRLWTITKHFVHHVV